MKNVYLDPQILSTVEMPMKKLMELNVKTMQGISYIKPADLMSFKKPEDFFEKNMDVFVKNGHMALDYMKDTFDILENHWLNVARGSEESIKRAMSDVASVAQKSATASASSAHSAAKKVVSSVNKVAKSAKAAASAKPRTASSVKSSVASNVKSSAQEKSREQARPSTQARSGVQTSPSVQANPNAPKVGGVADKTVNLHDGKGRNLPN